MYKADMAEAVVKFNSKPEMVVPFHRLFFALSAYYWFAQAIDWLVERKLIQRTPQDIAHFFYDTPGLSKTKLGEQLGKRFLFLNLRF